MKADMSQVLQAAKACHYAVPAMNYIDFASAKAYAKTSEKRKLPLILAFAQSHSQWLSLEDAALIGRLFPTNHINSSSSSFGPRTRQRFY